VDVDLARTQWEAYVAAFQDHGWDIVEVEPADDCPDAVFIEDTVVVFGDTAVITRPGAESRQAETAGTERAIRGRVPRLTRLESPASLDGGDVLKVGSTVYVGLSDRTNREAVEQLAALLGDRNVVGVPVTKVLHLKSAVTALPDGTVIGYGPLVDDPSVFETYLDVPEESGSAVVDLGNSTLLMAADCPQSTQLIGGRGYDVVTVDISEFQKLEGCVTCLSVRLR
ncbi:MAG: arginine deiminase family protein, partial [Acidimicrobiia bacterium]|nr:arginine deiminase family protein [Acidimicrobiia bacterium]